MNYISFCSGIEAATAAWHTLGWTPKAFCEIDKFPSRVLAHHYPDVPNLGDFTKVDWSQWSADVCVGGTPCQAFSVAGLRKSLQDERGNLSLEFIRAVNIIRPQYVVWENVPGVLSTSDNAFGCFLAGLVGCDEPIVFEQGWPNAGVVDGPDRRAAWRILDAQYFGLAQRRKRVFVVASSRDGPHPAEILFEWEGMRRDSPPSREAGEGPAGTIAARTRGGGGLGTDFDCDGGAVAMCLNAKGGGGRLDAESETLVAHSLRADGFDAAEECLVGGCRAATHAIGMCKAHYARYKRHGDPLAGRVREGDPMAFVHSHIGATSDDCILWPYAKLKSGYGSVDVDGKTTRVHRLMCQLAHGKPQIPELDACHSCGVRLCINPNHLRWGARTENMEDAIGHGMTTRGERHGNHKLKETEVVEIIQLLSSGETHDRIADLYRVGRTTITDIAKGKNWAWLDVAHTLTGNGFDSSEDGTGRGTPLVPVAFSCKDHGSDAGELAPTLRSMSHDGSHANGGGQVAVAFNLRGREGGAMPEVSDVASLRAASGGSSRSYVASMAVRRLTPRECERLQGFPDDYTAIAVPMPGEASRLKITAADGPRYKALGNSMAVPVMRWIGERIEKYDRL